MQAHIFYSGTVQGVGFRYATQRMAIELGLKGWVKNLKDGRVEILVEGREDAIPKFLQTLDKRFEGYIRDKKIDFKKEETPLLHKDFRILP